MLEEQLAGAGAALLGAVIGSASVIWVWRRERDERERHELATALHTFLTASDLLVSELRRLTPPSKITKMLTAAIRERRTTLDWLTTSLTDSGSHRVFQLQDRYAVAMNRVLAVAPQATLPLVERTNDLISSWDPLDEEWDAKWDDFRVKLALHLREVAKAEEPAHHVS